MKVVLSLTISPANRAQARSVQFVRLNASAGKVLTFMVVGFGY